MSELTKIPAIGAAPAGTHDRDSAARAVRQMFTAIAPRYDRLNHLLSLNIDRLWWRRTARAFQRVLAREDARVLDLCCGTGDMTFALLRAIRSPSTRVFGVDFSPAMLARALKKSQTQMHTTAAPSWLEADALRLPFSDAGFHLVTSAFGFRNLADYNAGLREIYRVLAPGGEVGILDFSMPSGLMGPLYRLYFLRLLPRIGRALSGVQGAYDSYLTSSVESFPASEEMLQRLRAVGFEQVSWTPYTFGIAGLYRGVKPAAGTVSKK